MPGKLLCALHGHSPSPTPNLALHVGIPRIHLRVEMYDALSGREKSEGTGVAMQKMTRAAS